MELFAEYYLEREGFETFATDKGFASFKIEGGECYIKDIFVSKPFRKTGAALEIAQAVENIAKERDCMALKGSCVPDLPGSTESMRLMIQYGFKLFSSHENFIVLIKELTHGR